LFYYYYYYYYSLLLTIRIYNHTFFVFKNSQDMNRTSLVAIFRYWKRPDASKESFDKEGWFITGDIAGNPKKKRKKRNESLKATIDFSLLWLICVEYRDGTYKILGRASVDILKVGGYKLSALQIETSLLAHPLVSSCAVVGVPDPTYGQRIAAIVSLRDPVSY
jgi:malonyl-CoA/methylmalonyl-CoA synthetase